MLVSAPTGVGKTLIADYLIENLSRRGKKAVYTAPIKALSNQKYKEFKALLGSGGVGILTGDVVINPDAPVLIMTTEVFRNILHDSPERLADSTHVIFDEIHFLDDRERGTVWEESIIFMPPGMRILGLSATIPNADQLAGWIRAIKGHEVAVVYADERVVPLEHRLFEAGIGFCTPKQLRKRYRKLWERLPSAGQYGRRAFPPGFNMPETTHLDLITALSSDYLPCLFFTFSRKKCEINARELAQRYDYLSLTEKETVEEVVSQVNSAYSSSGGLRRSGDLTSLLARGIGYHHAGLLPSAKDAVETLFEKGLLRVLYCTETFAVGLNFPCKTVCFDSVSKWDGLEFRPLSNREYFQMAGRAGRRGKDEKGYVFTVVDINYTQPEEIPDFDEDAVEPLKSQFTLTYNSVLNLSRKYDEPQIKELLSRSFSLYQRADLASQIDHNLESVQSRLSELAGCPKMDAINCPLVYPKLEKRMENKLHQLKKLSGLPRTHPAVRRLERSIQDLRRKLEASESERRTDCAAEQVALCRKNLKEYRRLQKEIDKLRKARMALPPEDRFEKEFDQRIALLQALDYMRGRELTARGLFASKIHVQELLVTELYMEGILHGLDPDQLNAVAVGIDYEPRKNELRRKHKLLDISPVIRICEYLSRMETVYGIFPSVRFNDHLFVAAHKWSSGAKFEEVLRLTDVDEGDVVYAFRRGIDLLRQIRTAAGDDWVLRTRIDESLKRMDRGEVSIVL